MLPKEDFVRGFYIGDELVRGLRRIMLGGYYGLLGYSGSFLSSLVLF
jgi:hypothetical protein